MSPFDKKRLSALDSPVFRHPLAVRFDDVDAAGVVFFARFFNYVHLAYESFLDECGLPLADAVSRGEWAAPLVHAEADYFRPLRLGDRVHVELVAARAVEHRLLLGWRVVREPPAHLVHAVAQTEHAFIAPRDGRRLDVPAELTTALESLLAAGLPGIDGESGAG